MWLKAVIFANLALHCLGFYADEFFNLKRFELKSLNDTKCGQELKTLYNGLKTKQYWAFQMIDATAKLDTGIVDGNIYNFGNFDECVAINDETPDGKIVGKYCLGSLALNGIDENIDGLLVKLKGLLMLIQTNKNTSTAEAQIGICVPSSCKAEDINTFLRESYLSRRLTLQNDFCQTAETGPDTTIGDIIIMIVFAIFVGLLIISTIYDTYLYYTKTNNKVPILLSFSLLTNARSLFIYKEGRNQITCLAGVRTMSLIWIIIGHQFTMATYRPYSNYAEYFAWIETPWSMYAVQATLAVDSFFLLSGTLLVYVYLNSKTNFTVHMIPMFYLHRLIRIVPALAALVVFHITFFKHLGSGPLWPFAPIVYSNCESSWWKVLTFTTNIGDPVYCTNISWYLTVDMQLYFLAPLILLPIKKYPRQTLLAVGLATIASMSCSFWTAWYYDFGPFTIASHDFMPKYYEATDTRAAPWFIGVLLGYLIYHVQNNTEKFRMRHVVVVTLWIISLVIMGTCIYGGNDLVVDSPDHRIRNLLHVTFVRPTWVIMVSWVIFACSTGYSGPVDTFLSLPMFQFLAKLGYSMYLIHTTILDVIGLSSRASIQESTARELYQFWSVYVLTISLGILWMLTFETPMVVLEKCIFKKSAKLDLKKDTDDASLKEVIN